MGGCTWLDPWRAHPDKDPSCGRWKLPLREKYPSGMKGPGAAISSPSLRATSLEGCFFAEDAVSRGLHG
jgi:hypothetical protein